MARLASLCVLFVGAQASQALGPTNKSQIPSIFSPQSTPAHAIYNLSLFVLSITLGIFLVVGGLLTYAVIKYRQRKDDDGHEPPQIYGSNQIELAWTVIPVLIVVALFLTTTRVILRIENKKEPAGAIDVVVIGHQFWWEFRYPKLGIVTANELHVPVGDAKNPAPAFLTLTSADVDHSFWVPRMAGKTDVIPNRINSTWIEPETAGLYLGQCAQFCGMEHAKMLLRVYAQMPAEFSQWVAGQRQSANQAANGGAGRAVFERNACINCHSIAGTVATGRFGPNLTHLMSRATIAAGAADNTPENLRRWVENPDVFKPGAHMPKMHLSNQDLDAVTAYLTTLH